MAFLENLLLKNVPRCLALALSSGCLSCGNLLSEPGSKTLRLASISSDAGPPPPEAPSPTPTPPPAQTHPSPAAEPPHPTDHTTHHTPHQATPNTTPTDANRESPTPTHPNPAATRSAVPHPNPAAGANPRYPGRTGWNPTEAATPFVSKTGTRFGARSEQSSPLLTLQP